MSTLITPASGVPPLPPAQPMTDEEFARIYGGQRVEYIDGQIRELPMPGARHGKICNTLAYFVTAHVLHADAGHVMSNDSFVRVTETPYKVLAPDVCFYSYERLPRGPVPDGILTVLPDLVAEVRSPSDAWTEVFGKVDDFLKAGVRVVVVIDPARLTASVYRPGMDQQIFTAEQELTVQDVLPGFAVRVGRLFDA